MQSMDVLKHFDKRGHALKWESCDTNLDQQNI